MRTSRRRSHGSSSLTDQCGLVQTPADRSVPSCRAMPLSGGRRAPEPSTRSWGSGTVQQDAKISGVVETYAGPIEYAAGSVVEVEIDDLDVPRWLATPKAVLSSAGAPDPWFVGVHLLVGQRAGHYATADLHR